MKKLYIFFLASVLFLSPLSFAKTPTVSVEVIHSHDKYENSKSHPVLLKLTVAKEWYIHSTKEEGYLIPTVLSFAKSEGINITNISFPDPEEKEFEYASDPVDVYGDTFYVNLTMQIGKGLKEGLYKITGELSYQACSEKSCLAPETTPIAFNLPVVPEGTATSPINQDVFESAESGKTAGLDFDSGLLLVLLVIFLQGLALNLTPCVYPLIPITLSFFGGRSDKSQGSTVLSGIVYLAGLCITNSIMGVSAALSGSMLGSALQNPLVLVFIALVMTTLAFSFFGFWEFELPSFLTSMASKNYQGYFGTFFMGLTLGIVAAPCIGPFVLSLLLYVGQKGDVLLGFLYFSTLGIGLGLPLCILAIFSGALNSLPKSGDWMVWIRKIFGWVLIGMGYYYVRPLISSEILEHIILLCLAVIAGIHLGWVDKSGKKIASFKYVKKGLSILIVISGIFYMYTAFDLEEGVNWTAYNEDVLKEAAENSKPAIMDVYADWCGPCRVMDSEVFTKPEIISLSENFVMVRIDITRKIENQEEIQKKYSIEGAPTVIFFDKSGNELPQFRIESEIEADEFKSHMKKALDSM